jgi:hypothetical protein
MDVRHVIFYKPWLYDLDVIFLVGQIYVLSLLRVERSSPFYYHPKPNDKSKKMRNVTLYNKFKGV